VAEAVIVYQNRVNESRNPEILYMTEQKQHSFVDETEDEIHERVKSDIKKHYKREHFTLEDKIIISAHKLAAEGHAAYLAGQITVRDKDDGTFWSTDFTRNFAEVTPADLVRFDRNMDVVEGSCMPNPGVRFHLWVYEQRPEVNAIVHTHPPYASALSMLEEELVIAHMDTMMLHGECAFLADWPGLPVGNSEGEIIAATLGKAKKCALLGHHGIITAGKSIEEALYLAVMLEKGAQLQLRAAAAGPIRAVDPSLAPPAHDFLLQDALVNATFDSWGRLVLKGAFEESAV
jgi:L-fuculose-phosphate aldolase